MSLNVSGYNISDIYVGNDKIDKIFVGDDLVYSSTPAIDYFYFEIDDPTLTAQVGFNEIKLAAGGGQGSIEYDSAWDTYLPSYAPLELYYSFNTTVWTAYNLGDSINIGRGYSSNKVYFRGINSSPSAAYATVIGMIEEDKSYTICKRITAFINSQDNAGVSAKGDIRTLRHYNNMSLSVPPCDRAYTALFRECTLLTHAPDLLYTTMTAECYASMFAGCTSLTTAPSLPATTLAERCYGVPANDVLVENLYPDDDYFFTVMGMFGKCTSLTTAPSLPATTLADYCYNQMFAGCLALVNAPTLPATTAPEGCYNAMFAGCRSLVNAPALPATTLGAYCYGSTNAGMFDDCRSLVNPPALPATTMANSCYVCMFERCTSLTSTPALPATTLANSCYMNMFYGCTSLTRITKLPALDIPDSAYSGMFSASSSSTSNVRANESSSGVCNQAYRIPTTGSGTAGSKALNAMFMPLSGDAGYTPNVNTTFYISVPSF